MGLIYRKQRLEKTGGFDESLAYGEDEDLGERLERPDDKIVELEDVEEYAGLVSSLREVFRQGRWYGKSMPQYFRKRPEAFPTLLSIFFFAALPLTTIMAPFHEIIFYTAVFQYFLVMIYVIEGIRRTSNPYMVFVPLIKVVRSYAEILGMVEGLFTEDLGRE
ncbi:MAG: glycosyltransferase family 2 protein [Candidatus Nanohaloarchaea archaeon]